MKVNIGDYKEVVSPLDLIKRISESKDFFPGPAADLSAGEQVIGTMNDEERVLWTARELVAEKIESAISSVSGLETKEDPLRQEIELLHIWHEAIEGLFWATLKGRFIEVLIVFSSGSLGVVSDYRVVSAPTPFSHGADGMTEDMLEAVTLSIFGAGMATHNCAECPKYEGCDLPIKKPLCKEESAIPS